MSTIKGRSQHVIPHQEGWAVYEAGRADILWYFSSHEDAMEFAHNQAILGEGGVLVYNHAPEEAGQTAILHFLESAVTVN